MYDFFIQHFLAHAISIHEFYKIYKKAAQHIEASIDRITLARNCNELLFFLLQSPLALPIQFCYYVPHTNYLTEGVAKSIDKSWKCHSERRSREESPALPLFGPEMPRSARHDMSDFSTLQQPC